MAEPLKAPHVAKPAALSVVYPHPGQTVFDDSTFLMGQVKGWQPGNILRIGLDNGQHFTIPVSGQGFFSFKVPVRVGGNRFHLKAEKQGQPFVTANLSIHGAEPLSVLPPVPAAVHDETLLPSSDIWLTEDDELLIACSASEGAQVSLTLPGFYEEPLALSPVPENSSETGHYLDTRQGIFAQLHWNSRRIPRQGAYQLRMPVRQLLQGRRLADNPLENLSLELTVQPKPADATIPQALVLTLPGTLTILTTPRHAVVTADLAVTRTAPVEGARLTSMPKGTPFSIDGLNRGWYRVRLSQGKSLYIAEGDAALVDSPAAVRITNPSSLKQIRIAAPSQPDSSQPDSNAATILLTVTGESGPIQIDAQPSCYPSAADRLVVTLYQCQSHCDFIHYPPNDKVVREIHWRASSETTTEVWIDLQNPLCGYDYVRVGDGWQITVKSLPVAITETRILIDPGHGGSEHGSTGLDGTPEKALNLAVSRLLLQALKAEGFVNVSLTREQDKDVSLAQRSQTVKHWDADILLSIHHNALPDGRDPQSERGVSTFYYHSFARSLAEKLLKGLARPDPGSPDPLPAYGYLYDSLYIPRIHQATSVLVELGFFTHPDDYEHLIRPDFQQAEVKRIARALKAYCQQRLASSLLRPESEKPIID